MAPSRSSGLGGTSRPLAGAVVLAAAPLLASPPDAAAWPQSAAEDTYPADITPPPGTQYHVQDDVLAALALQPAFFEEAAPLREAGRGMAEFYQVAEGRQASRHLISAWGRMQARYPSWSPETRDSIYHHLCALDLF